MKALRPDEEELDPIHSIYVRPMGLGKTLFQMVVVTSSI